MVILLLFGCGGCGGGVSLATDTADSGAGPDSADSGDSGSDTADTADSMDSVDSEVPVDADGDGYGDITDGGDDCDDTNPQIHPGAEEWCDSVDADCDGAPVGPGGCSEIQPFSEHAIEVGIQTYTVLPVRDVTGDGWDDFVVSRGGTTAIGVMAGDAELTQLRNNEFLVQFTPDGWQYFDYGQLDVGDLDGDGYNDIAIKEVEYVGGFFIQWGPISATSGTDPATWWDGDIDAFMWQKWAASGTTTGDFNGDGAADLAAMTDWEDTSVRVFFGGARDQRLGIVSTDAYVTPTLANAIGDVDGDGLDDLVIGGDNDPPYDIPVSWISGGNLQPDATIALDDAVSGVLVDDRMTDIPCAIYDRCFIRVGDWSGDGYNDVIASVYDNTEVGDYGHLAYYDTFGVGDVVPSGIVDNDAIHYESVEATDVLRHDGEAELLLLGTSSDDPNYLILQRGWYVGTWGLDDIAYLPVDGTSGLPDGVSTGSIHAHGLGDVTGDGWADVTITTNSGVWLFTPFDDIPWDEPAYWD